MSVEVKETVTIDIETTIVFKDILKAWHDKKQGILLEGGTYSSKTFSALQFLYYLASNTNKDVDINILSETIPHLKGGCIRDWFRILGESSENNPFYNKSEHIYRRWKGLVTFLSADNRKALGMRRDVLFINEGDSIEWEVARNLISRTEIFTIVDWNPRSEFWAHEYYKDDPNWAYNHSTYLDALDVIPQFKRDEIEDLGRKDPNYQNIYVLGLLGKIEGLVHPYFKQVDELPEGNTFYGLDFGFASDPTVLVKNVVIGGDLYSKQMFYKTEPMTNDDIAREMELLLVSHNDPIFPDPDEPKSAEELSRKGFNIQETEKGPGSKKFGIKRINQFNQYWTKDSLECIKEQKNYHYIRKRDNTGKEFLSDDTSHQWSHGIDGRRYGVAGYNLAIGKRPVTVRQKRS